MESNRGIGVGWGRLSFQAENDTIPGAIEGSVIPDVVD
jgi:hypothetical protein